MTRLTVAAVVALFAAARGDAQPPVPITPPPAGGVQARGPIVIPVPVTRPLVGYYKSGNVLVGADGYYPFDTGPYLLGGFEGLARYSGTYFMMPAGTASSPAPSTSMVEPIPVDPVPLAAPRGRFFHRR